MSLWRTSETRDMRDPRLSRETTTINTELVLNRVPEDDPFAEYMWMENEEEFNRQVSVPIGQTGTCVTAAPCP